MKNLWSTTKFPPNTRKSLNIQSWRMICRLKCFNAKNNQERCSHRRNHWVQGPNVFWMPYLTWGHNQVLQWIVWTLFEKRNKLRSIIDLQRERFNKGGKHGCSIAWTLSCNCSLCAHKCFQHERNWCVRFNNFNLGWCCKILKMVWPMYNIYRYESCAERDRGSQEIEGWRLLNS